MSSRLFIPVGAYFLAAVSFFAPLSARAQDSTDSTPRARRWRLVVGLDAVEGGLAGFAPAGRTLGVSYDFKDLGHGPEATGDPTALSLFFESTGVNPFTNATGNSQTVGFALRTAARPVYARLGAGLTFVNETEERNDAPQSVIQTVTRPGAFALDAFAGMDLPHSPCFVEIGGLAGNNAPSRSLCLRFGVRL